MARSVGRDVLLLDNGDLVDGTGLSNSTPLDGEALFPLLIEPKIVFVKFNFWLPLFFVTSNSWRRFSTFVSLFNNFVSNS